MWCWPLQEDTIRPGTGEHQVRRRRRQCTFGLGGAQQRVAGDHHVQDGLGQVGVQVSDRGREHDDVLGQRLVRVGQTAVHVADAVIRL